jgi:preprotein translocase subunit SecG
VLLYFFYTVHVLICIFLILVVLLQQGSGADLSVFGGGATQTAFGARSATSRLHRLTVAGFVGFIVTTIAIGFVKMGGPAGSVMSDVPVSAAEAPVEATTEEAAEAIPALPEATPDEAEMIPAEDVPEPVEDPAEEDDTESAAEDPQG